ncbi:M protein [Helicobacter pylori]|uniref:M protein n=1 Tax=Helicobacter pylori TaxID=210 RepID=UPI000D3B706A|nr:M protein [Helicobacter pylori]PUD86666.1 M protein [Helicobacter pylori]
MFGKSSNDTQENPRDAQKSTKFQDKYTKPTETTELNSKIAGLSAEKENLTKDKAESQKQVKALEQSQQALKNGNDELLKDREKLTTQNTELAEKIKALTTEKTELNNKITGLTTEKDNLTKDKENLTTELSTAKSQAEKTSQKLNELERRHAPYQKLEKLYEVFLEVKDRLNFNFVATTYSPMDLIAYVLSDSKYYLESLYNKASQELSDKRNDKGEKLAELFDLLFEYIKDSKFERLKEPSAYDHSCKKLYPEQNTSQKMQRVVLIGYTYDKKTPPYYTIVDMGS